MIPLERKNKILDLLEKNKHMTIHELAGIIYVSEMTVRRDLKQLEKEKLIKCIRGGAKSIEVTDTSNSYFAYSYRQAKDSDVKRELAKIAVSKIEKGDTIYIDTSSTASYIAEIIVPDDSITVVTSSFQTAKILAQRNIKHTLVGGCYHEHEQSFLGYIADSLSVSFNIDKMFFSSQGILPGDYIYDSSEAETKTRQIFLKQSKKKYFLCPSYKIGKKYMFKVCPADSDIEIIYGNTEKGGDEK